MINQFVAPNGRAIEEPKVVLTFILCLLLIFFFNRMYESWCHFCDCHTKFYFLKKYTSCRTVALRS